MRAPPRRPPLRQASTTHRTPRLYLLHSVARGCEPQALAVGGKRKDSYEDEQTLKAEARKGGYAGFALEVGEKASHGGYAAFKEKVRGKGRLDLAGLNKGIAVLTASDGSTLKLVHNPESDLPTVVRNGKPREWAKQLDLYKPLGAPGPISLGWKQGTLRIEAGGHVFEQTVTADGEVKHTP